MLVVLHFAVPLDTEPEFRLRAERALSALAVRPGYSGGRLGRSVDDPTCWVLVTEWEGVGAWRRALSSYEVKTTAVPLLAEAREEPTAFEVLYLDAGGGGHRVASDRAADADTAGPIP